MKKLSFIIPVYNAELFLRDCVMSITQQEGISDCEIILINDGSTDNSLLICNELSSKFDNIKTISQINQGTSCARNTGLNAANGEFIWFVDADDKVEPDFLKYLLTLINKQPNTDIFCFNHKILTKNSVDEVAEISASTSYRDGVDYINKTSAFYLWDKVFKKDFIGNARFLKGTKNIEDLLFCLQTIKDATTIYAISAFGYIYNCINQASTSRLRSKRNLIKLRQDSIRVIHEIKELANREQNIRKKKAIEYKLNFTICGFFFSLFRFYNYNQVNRSIKNFQGANMYPIKKTANKRANIFINLVNHNCLFLTIMRFKNFFLLR